MTHTNLSTPIVRIARPKSRPFQIRYFCPQELREIRISIGSRDEQYAEQRRREKQAELDAVARTPPVALPSPSPSVPLKTWEEFREAYRTNHLALTREKTAIDAESRLEIFGRIIRPKTLQEAANRSNLLQLQAKLLEGAESRKGKPRSAHTVRGYMSSILAALNWAYLQGWLSEAPRIQKIKTPRSRSMKGRPITKDEFMEMIKATPKIVGEKAAESWYYVLWGLWESALRLNELMHVSWSETTEILPIWREGEKPTLYIPATRQKNNTEEEIPLLPGFEKLLLETPPEKRIGWVFNPSVTDNGRRKRQPDQRMTADWVGKVISKIGQAAGVVVQAHDPKTGHAQKFASAHDLRRSCAERLRNAGVPPLVICRILRHSSWETTRKHYAPGDVQIDADVLQEILDEDE